MLLDVLPALRSRRVLLASASPRRRDLLLQLGLAVEVRPSAFSETLPKHGVSPQQYVVATARGKALDVFNALPPAELPDFIVSSDTVVVAASGEILEKPADREDARRMMRLLSGCTHKVMTAVCVVSRAPPAALEPTWTVESVVAGRGDSSSGGGAAAVLTSFVEEAAVTFARLPPALIDAYVATDEPYDKAGGYGIQGTAAQFIAGIAGDYYCVVGFPVHAFCALLRALAR